MTSSRSSDTVRTWKQIEGDFLQSCRILSLERRAWEGFSHVVSHRDEQDLGSRKNLFVCWLEMRRCLQIHWKGKRGFSVCMVLVFYLYFFFNDVGQLVSVTYLWVHDSEMFTILCCESWLLFLHLLWDIISHREMHSETFKKIYFHNILDGIFNLFLKASWSSCFQTPLLRKKALHLVRLEGISNDETRAWLI